LKIDDHFSEVQREFRSRPSIRDVAIAFDRRTDTIGYVRGEVYFDDGHVLHLREYVDTDGDPERLLYVYHLMDAEGTPVFRYDNSGHHREIASFPHHRHSRKNEVVEECAEPSLEAVLDEVEQCLDLGFQ
jgi:hypothetical protein